jgi:hypothetical protein
MSSMAKIFVVVNLILGVMAFGSAATLLGTKEDYKTANKDMAAKFEVYKSDQEGKLKAANGRAQASATDATNSATLKATAEQKNEELTRRLAGAETANGMHRATIEKLTETERTLLEINKSYKSFLQSYAKDSSEATKDKLNYQTKWQNEVANRVNLEAEVKKCQAENSQLSAMNGDLAKQLKNCKFWLGKYRQQFGDITGGPTGANGVVKSVKGNLVVLSVGSDDGVRNGDTYQIRRGSNHVGQVTVTRVYKDQSVGTFDTNFKGPAAPPQAGDAAEAKGY